MKKLQITFLATFVAFFIGISISQAQDKGSGKTQAIKVKPISGVAYERLLKDKVSLDVTLLHHRYGSNFGLQDDFVLTADGRKTFTGIMPQVRFYTSKKKDGMRGFYVAPYVALGVGTATGTVENADLQYTGDVALKGIAMEMGANLGWQWMIGDGFLVGVQGGLGWGRTGFAGQQVTANGTTQTVKVAEGTSVQIPNVQFTLGYAF